MARRVFVGDIQGCRLELEALLRAVGFSPATDVLHPVGDLVRKGPDNEGVLGLLMDLDAQPVLGNHDLRFLERGEADDPAHEAWLRRQPIIRVMPDIVMVHAGLHPRWCDTDLQRIGAEGRTALAAEVAFAVMVRYCDPEGHRPAKDRPPPPAPYAPWYEFYAGSRRVVFGHWARRGLVRTDRVIGLDTGCVYGKKLTAWIAEEDRIVQVPGHTSADHTSPGHH